MLKITLHHMRTGWVRILAAGIAIMLGTGFVAATLIAGETIKSAAYQSITADFRGTDVVVEGYPLGKEQIEQISADSQVDLVHSKAGIDAELRTGGGTQWGYIAAVPPSADLLTTSVEDGELPAHEDEAALRSDIARRLGVDIGDDVTVIASDWSEEDADEVEVTFTITGLLAEASNFFSYGNDALITEGALTSSPLASLADNGPLAIKLTDGVDAHSYAQSLSEDLGADYSATTVTALAEDTTEIITGSAATFTNLLLGFAGVALAVAILVIGNTFAVLVAQRTRLLALLRTVGASRAQVRLSVLMEAGILGLVASLMGVALGYGVMAAAVAAVSPSLPGINLWKGMILTPHMWFMTVLTGLIITLIASWLPARSATKVRPLAALRPEPVSVGTTAGKFRAAVSLLAFAAGASMLIGGTVLARSEDTALVGLLIGVLGGFVSVFGILLGAVFVVRPVVHVVGLAFGRGPTARIATTGAIRNPRRTAATTNALFIGVALVTMMSTGAASVKATLDDELTGLYPVDINVSTVDGTALTHDQLDALRTVEGIDVITHIQQVEVTLDTDIEVQEQLLTAPVSSVAGAAGSTTADFSAGDALSDPSIYTQLGDAEAIVPDWLVNEFGLEIGDDLTVRNEDGGEAELRVGAINSSYVLIASADTMSQIAPDIPVNGVWIKVTPGASPITVIQDLEDVTATISAQHPDTPLVSVDGPAVERAAFEQVINTLLLIVTGLLAVAVVIALVGVANTLSLSVLERRRESATLRALGLTKGQLRGMLAIEGVTIAVVGAIFGAAGGLAYGWAGSATLLATLGPVKLAVPWAGLGAVFGVAIVAGLLASVLPARSAVRVSPVAALAEE